jgi:hypothetical protein
MRRAFMIGVALLFGACKAGAPSFHAPSPDGGAGSSSAGAREPAAPPAVAPAAPSVTAPELTSLSTVALRGSSPGAAQIVVQAGDATTEVSAVLPDGTFCIDVPLQAGEVNPIKVFATGNGKASAPALVSVVQAPNWPAPANGTCTISSGGGSAPSCNDAAAACDPRCNGCPEDAYQPNFSPAQAPAIALRSSYPGLQLCPCRADWFTFVLYKGQHIKLQASYQKTADFDLDLGLYRGADVLPQPTGNPSVVATTAGTSDGNATRTIDFTATDGGAYYLQIAATTDAKAHGSYALATESE